MLVSEPSVQPADTSCKLPESQAERQSEPGQTTAKTRPSVVSQLGLDDRTVATLAHASGLIGMLTVGILGFLGPLAIYLMYQDRSEFVTRQAKEALNFQISLLLLSVASVMLTILSCGVAFPLVFVVPVMQLLFGIIAPMQVWAGNDYRYPLTMRLFR